MKQFIYLFSFVILLAGCSDSATVGKESKTTVKEEKSAADLETANIEPGINDVDVDTIGMAEFLAMKAAEVARSRQSNGIASNDISDGVVNDINVDTIGFAEFKRQRAETARRAYEDSVRRAEMLAERRNHNASGNSKTSTPRRAPQVRESAEEREPDQTKVAERSTEPVKEKKGWSNRAKGAVIGAATGAAAGAVIHKKKRGVGGIVGGVVGAAAGYGIGRHKDRKDTARKEQLIQDTSNQQQ